MDNQIIKEKKTKTKKKNNDQYYRCRQKQKSDSFLTTIRTNVKERIKVYNIKQEMKGKNSKTGHLF